MPDNNSDKAVVVVVIGAGLAGLTATLSLLQQETQSRIRILLIDKSDRIGGNSAKASSGINACQSKHQTSLAEDTPELFMHDSIMSGHGLSDDLLLHVLATHSASALDWLEHQTGLEISHLTRCGGHSVARTHKEKPAADDKPKPIGWDLIRSLKKRLQDIIDNSFVGGDGGDVDRVKIMLNSRCTELLRNGSTGEIYAVRIITQSQTGNESTVIIQPTKAVILTSGGYAFDIGAALDKVPPSEHVQNFIEAYGGDVSKLPTTNGPWATGDGLKLAQSIGALAIHLSQIQVHPTAFVDPANPDSRTKILAPEGLRAVGAVLISPTTRNRFTNELGRRDDVTKAILDNCGKISNQIFVYLVATKEMLENFDMGAVEFYVKLGLLSRSVGFVELSSLMNISAQELRRVLVDEYSKFSNQGSDRFGKTVFPQLFGGDDSTVLYVGKVTPAMHYSMGGIVMTADAQLGEMIKSSSVSTKTDFHINWFPFELPVKLEPGRENPKDFRYHVKAVEGLFGAGEATAGVHGGNRLAGNSLLECVVFGRIAAKRVKDLITAETSHNFVENHTDLQVQFWDHSLSNRFGILRLNLPSPYAKFTPEIGDYFEVDCGGGGGDEKSDIMRLYPITHPSLKGAVDLLVPKTEFSERLLNAIIPMKSTIGVRKMNNQKLAAAIRNTLNSSRSLVVIEEKDIGAIIQFFPGHRINTQTRIRIVVHSTKDRNNNNNKLPFIHCFPDDMIKIATNPREIVEKERDFVTFDLRQEI